MSSSTPDQTSTNSTALQNVNSATLGATMPVVNLPDGSQVQTGTFGALLMNIKTYNALHLSESDSNQSEKKADLERKMEMALPLLMKVGLFDLFAPDEWINVPESSPANPGKKFVGEAAKRAIAAKAQT